jgi:hypothetical protein
VEQVLPRSWGAGVAQMMYTHVNKCKNNKMKEINYMKVDILFIKAVCNNFQKFSCYLSLKVKYRD